MAGEASAGIYFLLTKKQNIILKLFANSLLL